MGFDPARIADEAVDIFLPLAESLRTPDGLSALLARLGYSRDAKGLTGAVGQLASLVTQIDDIVTARDKGLEDPEAVAALLAAVVKVQQSLPDIARNIGALPATIIEEIAGVLLVNKVLRDHPLIFDILILLGVIRREESLVGTPNGRDIDFVPFQFEWANLSKLVTDPVGLFRDVYGWGTANFDGQLLVLRLARVAESAGAQIQIDIPDDTLMAAVAPLGGRPPWLANLLIIDEAAAGVGVRAGVAVMPAQGATATDGGLAVMPVVEGNVGLAVPLTETLSITFEAATALAGGMIALIRPQSGLTFKVGVLDGNVGIAVSGAVGLKWASPAEIALVGSDSGSRLSLQSAALTLRFAKDDFGIEVAVPDAAIVVQAGDGDGFLQSALPKEPMRIPVPLGVGCSYKRGIYFAGGGGLEVTIPFHKSFGPILIDNVELGIKVDPAGLHATSAVSGGLALGPLAATVDQIGVEFVIEFGKRGVLGFADARVGFKPPTGLGLDIEAAAVSGGGFISFDQDKGEYAGELELSVEILQLKAFALLDTKPEVSFVIIISADFPPIELGFGFSLTGVGGLLGINRTMSLDTLRAAFRNHSIDNTLFLQDPASQAGQIVQNIASIFPIMDGHFVFGPFVQISWGEPILVVAELGFILTLPDPVRLAILGAIVAALPDPDTPIVILKLDVLGTIDFDQQTIAIDASLYDSYVAAFSVAGDMAFRMNYGDKPDFALSLGGLNPKFQPPPAFPSLKRLSISLGNSDNPRIGVEGYLAITSNTVQFGAHAELTARAAGFSIHGYESFDALVTLSPFGFIVDFSAGVDLLHGSTVIMSIGVDGTLSGTSPWHIHGDGHIHVLFFDISVSFDATFGQSGPPQNLPTTTVIDKFTPELRDPRNWQGVMPPDASRVATLAAARPEAGVVLVHPMGQLRFQQTLLPLNVPIAKFGSATITDANQFAVTPSTHQTIVSAEFADAQFFILSDDDKVSKPSFSQHDGGVSFDPGPFPGTGTGQPSLDIKADIVYDTIIRQDDMAPTKNVKKNYALTHTKAVATAGFGSTAIHSRRTSGAQKYVPPGQKSGIAVSSPSYVVVDKNTMRRDSAFAAGGYSAVQSRLAAHIAKYPSTRGTLQIVPAHELQAG